MRLWAAFLVGGGRTGKSQQQEQRRIMGAKHESVQSYLISSEMESMKLLLLILEKDLP